MILKNHSLVLGSPGYFKSEMQNTLKIVTDNVKYMNSSQCTYFVFIGLKKAFDTIRGHAYSN